MTDLSYPPGVYSYPPGVLSYPPGVLSYTPGVVKRGLFNMFFIFFYIKKNESLHYLININNRSAFALSVIFVPLLGSTETRYNPFLSQRYSALQLSSIPD